MKKHVLLIVVALVVGFAFAAVSDYVPVDYRSAFEVTNSNTGKMNIRFTLPEYTLENVTVGDMQFQKVHIQDAGQTVQDGLPQLPYLTITLAIPYQGAPQLSFIGAQTQVINNIRAYPVQEGIAEESPKGFVYDAAFYQTNTLYPQSPLECSEPYILRDFRLLSIQVNPFSYNATTQELTVSESMEFELDFTDQPSANEIAGEFVGYSPAFRKIYEANIFNFDDYRNYVTANQPPRYLIIYGGTNHDNSFQTALNNFVLWKRQKGAEVDLAGRNETGSSNTTIKSYIQGRYDNPLTRPDFIILLGDTTGSYSIPCFATENSGVSDYNYTFLAGNDSVGDVMIGRISVENISQLQTLFAKIYLYERDLNISTADWLNRMLLVGDPSSSGISCIYISKYIKELALKVNPNYTFTELYSGSFSTGTNQAINNGVAFFSYRGYISMSGWSPDDPQLSNGYKLLHAVIPTCGSGNYGSTATSENFIRMGTANAPKGAVTATGMCTIYTKTITNNTLSGGTFGGLFIGGMRTMGEAVLNGKILLHETFGPSYYNSTMLKHASWFNLMGDPTMEVFVGIPDTFSAIVPTTIALGSRLLDVVALNGALEHVADASVTLSQGQSILSKGYTDANGAVTLFLPAEMDSTDCVLTISKHDFKPVQITITVDATGTLTPGTLIVDDDNQGQSQGNADGNINAGETIELTFGINNTKAQAINGVSGYLICDSPYVTIVDSTATFGNIPAGQMIFNNPPIVLQIANNIPNNTNIKLTLQLIDSEYKEYQVADQLSVGNAEIMYHSYQVIDAGVNNVLDPGETGGLRVTLSNVGAQALTGVSARLYSDNDLVSVTSSNIVFYGDLLKNIEITPNSEAFGLKARDQVLPGMTIPMRMKIYNDAGFEQWVYFSFTVGSVTVHSPLGPDEYGYVIYDDGDVFYEECPIYDWIGIAPAEGGFGTALPITDTHSSYNEGDQTAANSLAVVTLPFTFQFYGESYSQITVCSNGFLVMGVTENAEFRNYRIPGPMGPGPMIAPFWDDLATHTGSGIYTFFDRSNHAFIIEWYNMRNGANGSAPETFQVILYDPAVHAGSMGDGPIKIQYHTFNNVDASTSVPGHHGRHATIGIQNGLGNIGLEYSFANTYPTAASPLGNNRALYITNVPIHYEAPHMVIGETHVTDPNNNGVCEPGETINLGVELSNIGN
ncbi:MAG: C25 family cysteine peptidase, partial [Candidatus Cloacimonadaceae bacterium]